MATTDTRSRLASRGLLAAYLILLLVPVFLLLDVVLAWRFPANLNELGAPAQWWVDFGTTGQAVFVVSLAWVVLGLALLAAAWIFKRFSAKRLQGPVVAFYTIVATLLLVEGGLNIVSGGAHPPALWPPGREALLSPDPNLMPGIEGEAKFTGNDVGLRGPTYPANPSEFYKIITVGGSTTESLYLDDSEEWPHLLMDGLNAQNFGPPVWVGNGGQSGRNAVDHLELVRVLPVISEAQLVIFLVGINDLQATLSFDGASTQDLLEANGVRFRDQVVNGGDRLRPARPYFKRTELFTLAKNASARLVNRVSPTSALGWLGIGPGSFIAEKRQQRADAPTASLPNLKLGLEEYQQRIRDIAAECDSRGLRCMYVTQPSMWRADLSPQEQSLLWFGWVREDSGSIGYIALPGLVEAMDTFNQGLLDVCTQDQLECFDLDAGLPKDTSVFYDDFHFNEGGGRMVSQLLTDYLIANTPPSE